MNERLLNIDSDRIIDHWVETSDEDFQTMLTLFDAKSFGWALFIGHIMIEKLLKAYFVKRNHRHAPFTHNLYRLAELSELQLTNEYSDWLDKITAFNMNARYDDYKREFHSMCTFDFTKGWIEKITLLRSWIKEKL